MNTAMLAKCTRICMNIALAIVLIISFPINVSQPFQGFYMPSYSGSLEEKEGYYYHAFNPDMKGLLEIMKAYHGEVWYRPPVTCGNISEPAMVVVRLDKPADLSGTGLSPGIYRPVCNKGFIHYRLVG